MLFSQFGEVTDAIRANPNRNKLEPFGYITFSSCLSAQKAISQGKVKTGKRPILVHSYTSNKIVKLLQRLDRDPARRNINHSYTKAREFLETLKSSDRTVQHQGLNTSSRNSPNGYVKSQLSANKLSTGRNSPVFFNQEFTSFYPERFQNPKKNPKQS